jgi:hypothetical protein
MTDFGQALEATRARCIITGLNSFSLLKFDGTRLIGLAK